MSYPSSHPHPTIKRRDFIKTLGVVGSAAAFPATFFGQAGALPRVVTAPGREMRADVVVVGATLGGVAAALAAARAGRTVILTEETSWIGGQATTEGVPLDEHPYIEEFGRTRSYRDFRDGVRSHYRRNYPLIDAARADPTLNPGAAWVTALSFEPRIGMAVLYEMLAPHLAAGRLVILTRHRPISVSVDGTIVRAVTVRDELSDQQRILSAAYFLDATPLGELIELGDIERVIGAEAQAETGEPNAREGSAAPQEQMGFTHVAALEHITGGDFVIPRPAEYERFKPRGGVQDLFGVAKNYNNEPVKPGHYINSTWKFRRQLCQGNFLPGSFASDITSLMAANGYNRGVLCGVSPEVKRQHLLAARQLTLSVIYWLQTEAPNPLEKRNGYPGLRPRGDAMGTTDGLAQYPYIRESCRIRAEFTVLEQHFHKESAGRKEGPMKYPDSVGVSGYRIDIHKPAKGGAGGSMTIANHGKHWCQQIPLGALIPVRVENLLPASKNLGVTAVTNGAFRVHPAEWNIGEAAGALAAYCVAKALVPRQVRNTPRHVEDFQRELVKQGFELDWPRPLTALSYFSYHEREAKDAGSYYFGEAWNRK